MRTPLTIIAVLVAALLGLSVLTSSAGSERGGSHGRAAPSPSRVSPVAVIARRVQAIRHLRYRHVPVPERVPPAQARRDGLADFDASEPPRRRSAEEQVLELLGLVPRGTSLRRAAASLFGEGVAGYYDPRSGRLKVVTGTATSTRVLTETVLAHELTHALEDQRFRLLGRAGDSKGDDDAALATLALIEGSATEVMQRYTERWFTRGELLAGAIASAFAPSGDLPPFLQSQTLFPYLSGDAFVQALLRRAGGRWDLVDTAERLRPPASTEQVLHPERYLRADEPKPVRIAAGRALGRRWTRALTGTWGEFETRDLLTEGGAPDAAGAAAGWGGDRLELWRARPGTAAALVLRWRWDTPRDERQFAAALRAWATEERTRLSSSLAIADHAGAVTLALAPTPRLAARLARAGR
jgi:hypothetical protein